MTTHSGITRRTLLMAGAAAALAPPFGRSRAAQDVCAGLPTARPIKPQIERAVSLREVIELLKAGKPARLEGLTRLDGYVLDKDNDDIGLIGLAEKNQPELRVADFVVALRSAFLKGVHDGTDYSKSAAISIDSDPQYFRHLDQFQTTRPDGRRLYLEECSRSHWRPVRVDGMIRHSRLASVLVEADYRMKRTAQGVLKLPLRSPLLGDFDALLAEWRARLAAGRDDDLAAGITRYWFMPGRFEHVASADRNTVFLDHAQVVLRDEDEVHRPGDKEAVATGKIDPHARAFTCAWTARMEEIYQAEPIWRDMHNMYRHFAITRIMYDHDAFDAVRLDLDFLLEGYRVPRVNVPDTIPGSGRVETHVRQRPGGTTTYARSTCGGVDIGFNKALPNNPDAAGEVRHAGQSALASRPGRTVLAWAVAPSSVRPASAASAPHARSKGGGLLDDVDPNARGVIVVPGRR